MTQPERQKPVIVVIGPTGSGKTALGVHLAKLLDSEVISADSQLVYQGLDIGTAKPTLAEREGIPHHLIDCVPPTENYSVAQFRREAQTVLTRLHAQNKVPIVVGGTGFYVKALLQQDEFPHVAPDSAFRNTMNQLAETQGNQALYQQLQAKDPERAAMLHPNDRFRVIRALEIIEQTGLPVPKMGIPRFENVIWVGLTYDNRERMRERIDQRIEAMLAAGWLNEVRGLLEQYGPTTHALQVAHGYPELGKHLQGELTLADAISQIQINIHQYATRQITWYRHKLFQETARIDWHAVDAVKFTTILELVSRRMNLLLED